MPVNIGKNYKLQFHIPAIQKAETRQGRGTLTRVPETSIVKVQGIAELPNMVEVLWNHKTYIVFAADLEVYGSHLK